MRLHHRLRIIVIPLMTATPSVKGNSLESGIFLKQQSIRGTLKHESSGFDYFINVVRQQIKSAPKLCSAGFRYNLMHVSMQDETLTEMHWNIHTAGPLVHLSNHVSEPHVHVNASSLSDRSCFIVLSR